MLIKQFHLQLTQESTDEILISQWNTLHFLRTFLFYFISYSPEFIPAQIRNYVNIYSFVI